MTLFVDEVGERGAPTVVLLHGAGTSGWIQTRQVAALATDLHVLVPDLPGHGRSNALTWTSIADMATAMADAVASRASDRPVHIVGLSLGGYVGLRLAASGATWVASATVSGVNVLPFPNPRVMKAIGVAITPFLGSGPLLRANARALRIPPEDVPGYRTAARSTTRQAFRRINAQAIDFRLPPDSAASPCPVLAVAGADEHELTRRSVASIAAAFPHGRGRLVPGVGHAWNGEQPDVFTAMTRAQVLGGELPAQLQPA